MGAAAQLLAELLAQLRTGDGSRDRQVSMAAGVCCCCCHELALLTAVPAALQLPCTLQPPALSTCAEAAKHHWTLAAKT